MSRERIDNGLLDPSLGDGDEVLFNREIPLEVRAAESAESKVLIVRFKLIGMGDDHRLEQMRIEMSSDTDVFFFFKASFTATDFAELRKAQQLTISFEEFPGMLIDILTQNVAKEDTFQVVFTQDSETHGTLDFCQILKFKRVDIFSLEFVPASQNEIREQIQYRYDMLKSDLKSARAELSDLCSMLKINNPSTLKLMRRTRT